ncbi:hypothetical protein DAPPUDRAFT_312466 [Daphnia pulex]|uniref:Uncharacterized protein n=1 Tax=Daphnia pulex TaxID=6669 RepID=E9G0Y1_DAPPU|nr:hypothetical protein DAPPUDRAFT_312466 [Daphnia pulex]|eukprot:EFX87322.1 hypothetical protein DAPPUDRAFT_312466 [Daphnia pulex]
MEKKNAGMIRVSSQKITLSQLSNQLQSVNRLQQPSPVDVVRCKTFTVVQSVAQPVITQNPYQTINFHMPIIPKPIPQQEFIRKRELSKKIRIHRPVP